MALLRILKGPGAGTWYPLDEPHVTAGRDPGNTIQLLDDMISRRHAEFRLEGDRHVVADLGSINGVWVNGERVDRRILEDGDRVRVGRVVLLYERPIASPDAVVGPPGAEPGGLHPGRVVDTRYVTVSDMSAVQRPGGGRGRIPSAEVDEATLRTVRERSRLIAAITEEVVSGTTPQQVMNLVVSAIDQLIEPDRVVILQRSGRSRVLEPAVISQRKELVQLEPTVPHNQPLILAAVREQRAFTVNVGDAMPTRGATLGDARFPTMVTPVFAHGSLVGVIYLDNVSNVQRPFSALDGKFVGALANQLGFCLGQRRIR